MKKIGIILITTVLAACTERDLLAPVTPVSPDGQALIVPTATVVTMEGTSDVMPRYKAAEASMPGMQGTTRATTYPYGAVGTQGNVLTVLVSADENGQAAGATFHSVWTTTPVHDENHPYNSLAPRLEVAKDDATKSGISNPSIPWNDAVANFCESPWRFPTLAELKFINTNISKITGVNVLKLDNYYWTATDKGGDPTQVYWVAGQNNNSGTRAKTGISCLTRCVRDAYPYVTTNASGQRTVIVSQDAYGASFEPMHAPWTKTPNHYQQSPLNSVSHGFEVSKDDVANPTDPSTTEMNWYLASGTESTSNPAPAKSACKDGWRLPTLNELLLINSMRGQLTGVTPFTDGYDGYYAMTESTMTNYHVFRVQLGNTNNGWFGDSGMKANPAYVRCVRDITRPLPPRPGSGSHVDGAYPFCIWTYAGTVEPTSWKTAYFANAAVLSTATGFEMYAPQYYPADGTQKLYFYASAPSHGGSVGSETVEPLATHFLTDGLKDVMWAKDVRGIAKNSNPAQQQQPSFLFQHVLKQVQFKVKMDDTFEAGKTLTKLTLKNVAKKAFIKLISGTTTFSGTSDIVHTLATPITLTTTAQDACTLMFEPGATFTIEAVVDGVTYPNISVTLTGGTTPGAAGTANVVTITFKRAGVTTSATLTGWNAVQSSDIDVDK